MKKIIRLTESDLNRIVKRITRLNEEDDFYASVPHFRGEYLDKKNKKHHSIEYDESRTFGPDEYDDFMDYINDCDTNWCLKTKEWYDRYAKGGPIVVARKRR